MAADPLGFSKQTATILRGLGATSLISECKKRNISTDLLHELTREDFVKLGAEERKAEELRRALSGARRHLRNPNLTLEDRRRDFHDIIKNGEQQLSLLEAFVAYSRFRLKKRKERIDCYVDPDRSLTASDILPISVEATIKEIERLEKAIRELENEVS